MIAAQSAQIVVSSLICFSVVDGEADVLRLYGHSVVVKANHEAVDLLSMVLHNDRCDDGT